MAEDQVDPVVESPEEPAPLDNEGETQVTDPASPVDDSAAAVEETPVDIAALTKERDEAVAARDRSVKGYDELTREHRTLQETARPLLEAQKAERDKILSDEEHFQKRVDAVGVGPAMDERTNALLSRYSEAQAQQQYVQQSNNAWGQATTDTNDYGVKQGLTVQDVDLLRAQFNNFPAGDPNTSVNLGKLAIDALVLSRGGTKQEETLASDADKRARQVVANQPASGTAVANQTQQTGAGAEFVGQMKKAKDQLSSASDDL